MSIKPITSSSLLILFFSILSLIFLVSIFLPLFLTSSSSLFLCYTCCSFYFSLLKYPYDISLSSGNDVSGMECIPHQHHHLHEQHDSFSFIACLVYKTSCHVLLWTCSTHVCCNSWCTLFSSPSSLTRSSSWSPSWSSSLLFLPPPWFCLLPSPHSCCFHPILPSHTPVSYSPLILPSWHERHREWLKRVSEMTKEIIRWSSVKRVSPSVSSEQRRWWSFFLLWKKSC